MNIDIETVKSFVDKKGLQHQYHHTPEKMKQMKKTTD